MSQTPQENEEDVALSLHRHVDEVCLRFERAWKAGHAPCIEDHLGTAPELECALLFRELLALDLAYRRQRCETISPEQYRQRFPEYLDVVEAVFEEAGLATQPSEEVHPVCLGRYRLTAKLGAGSFGVVYKGYDADLRRDVAIKVPHRHHVTQPEDVEVYLSEARILARLDHPNIVPVYDVGSTGDGLCYVVSKFIEGSNLVKKLQEAPLPAAESAGLLASVAEALHYAHRQGLVHRDIKPGNILLDSRGKPYVADFGLALREEDFGTGPSFAGTPAYMSPEQARREGHRVDARSDIFSLGAVLYELLTGVVPFPGNNLFEVLQGIKTLEPCPPRHLVAVIPKELERICLKALAKRASERYMTAKDLADDLRHFLGHASEQEKAVLRSPIPPDLVLSQAATTPSPSHTPDSDQRPIRIVPKGLRCFDAGDADFFLELLPGPRDRFGLPGSIRFWKSRIEDKDPDNTFTVGLIYGPSGCGKSSLVRAGLLPRLAADVRAVYVDTTAEETEARLLKGLRKHCPDLQGCLGLWQTLEALRRGRGVPEGGMMLIVLDQFEQWLHAKRGEQSTELVQALRQCDGERVQCLILVRDDFWLAVSRFMADLEVELVQGRNMAMVDLFDPRHAKKVLAAFGRAFAALPERTNALNKEQETFLNQAILGLSQDGKIIPVRLALFAEMVKDKPWTPATLKAAGGMEGMRVRFLEETFAAATAPPQHRLHQKATQGVLRALLPEAGTTIKGQMRSKGDLLEASGYVGRPEDFKELVRILDTELRLITPTDPEGMDETLGKEVLSHTGERCYQLTHDYLVPSLRDWLTRKQKETRRGRAELRLAELAATWNAKPESRHLPAGWEWAKIRLFSRKRDWTASQKAMMRRAGRYYTIRGVIAAALLLGLAFGGLDLYRQKAGYASALVDRLIDAEIERVPEIVAELGNYRAWVNPRLAEIANAASLSQKARLHAKLALLPVDPGQVDSLSEYLLVAQPRELKVICEALRPYHDQLRPALWQELEDPGNKSDRRFRAACALAVYDATNAKWRGKNIPEFVTDRLLAIVQQNPSPDAPVWKMLRPVREQLIRPLGNVFRNPQRSESERLLAVGILTDYACDQPGILADLLMDADEKQFAVVYPELEKGGERALKHLSDELDRKLQPKWSNPAAKRQANAAVALLKMGQRDKVWPLLRHTPDPSVRSYLIHRLGPLEADPKDIIKRLGEEKDVSSRRALLLSLGEYGEKELPVPKREVLLPDLFALYRQDPDPGVHGAVEWLLRQWQQSERVKEINQAWAKDQHRREAQTDLIRQELAKDPTQAKPAWYVNGQGQTMIVIPGPVEFLMGSRATEAGHSIYDPLHHRRIGRTFALAATPVTVEQYLRFQADVADIMRGQMTRYPQPDCPVGMVSWYKAAEYCNWLSKEEELPEAEWCYKPNKEGQYEAGMKPAPDYLRRRGYRLPTEAEWEYACRAGAVTSWYYGQADELLRKYANYGHVRDVTSPAGSLKPNDFGLFDMHGNLWNWCQERTADYGWNQGGRIIEDKEDIVSIEDGEHRALRGGSFISGAASVRSAVRHWALPATLANVNGFRPARTFD